MRRSWISPFPQLQRPGQGGPAAFAALVPVPAQRARDCRRGSCNCRGGSARAWLRASSRAGRRRRTRPAGGLGQELALSSGCGPHRAHPALGRAGGSGQDSHRSRPRPELLAHLAAAWDAAHPDAPLAGQEVVITVPASFDEVARAFTVEAARQAGLEKFTLVEEPQAAFYDFTARHRHDLAAALNGVRLVLVVDIGGGTTDFTLVQVGISPEGPACGGLPSAIISCSEATTWTPHWPAKSRNRCCRRTQTQRHAVDPTGAGGARCQGILAQREPAPASRPRRHRRRQPPFGRLAFGGSSAEAAGRMILDGFFPSCSAGEVPRRAARMALQELGLPYAQDAAITRHLSAFLGQHAPAGFAALAKVRRNERVAAAGRHPV